jgi:thiol:disulfide interchange protein
MAVRTLVALLVCTAVVFAQGKSSDSVVTAKATTKAEGGKQVVTITLDVNPEYHIYANPVGNPELAENQTTVTLAGKGKLGKVEYPAGEEVKDKVVGDYKVYHGKVTIKTTVEGAGPHTLAIKIQACSKKACLLPGTLKVTLP